jgi:hypothetical protein
MLVRWIDGIAQILAGDQLVTSFGPVIGDSGRARKLFWDAVAPRLARWGLSAAEKARIVRELEFVVPQPDSADVDYAVTFEIGEIESQVSRRQAVCELGKPEYSLIEDENA